MLTRRSAFTLVEVIATMAIIGALAALLFPAVAAARESARQAACATRLRQVMLYVTTFNDANSRLPPRRWTESLAPFAGGPGAKSVVALVDDLRCPSAGKLPDRHVTTGFNSDLCARPLPIDRLAGGLVLSDVLPDLGAPISPAPPLANLATVGSRHDGLLANWASADGAVHGLARDIDIEVLVDLLAPLRDPGFR